ncbi:unnamed protein product [Commensalibacter communis]|uniref:Uncharacterized protein n=1 Tax=Commensalibacter communis TaxID=2972786 RepID=A0A9W4XE97_9PROT|nr:hypothetical protein [Commensalibacter communis]CAI3960216.1 unnamed protein product [Commensalibacter communis]CAI3961242.1 unnamed protein product [Commensalibacter communis]CAI3961371.1 unnamed protein product [Commensalibacter communis]CAI3961822.1 unnamed protein product [Commensalibacter communis]
MDTIYQEWSSFYPGLQQIVLFISYKKEKRIEISTLYEDKNRFDDFVLELEGILEKRNHSVVSEVIKTYLNSSMDDFQKFKLCADLCSFLYRAGIVGIKLAAEDSVQYSFRNKTVLHKNEINEQAKLYIHPTFLSALAIEDN